MISIKKRLARFATNTVAATTLLTGAALVPAQATTLHYASSSPPTDMAVNRVLRWWADELNTRTDGSLDIEFHWKVGS